LISLIYTLKRFPADFGLRSNLYYCQSEVTTEVFQVHNGQGAPRWGISVMSGPEVPLVVGATDRQPEVVIELLGDRHAIEDVTNGRVSLQATVSDGPRLLPGRRVEVELTEAQTGAENTDGRWGSVAPALGWTNERGEISLQYIPAEAAKGRTITITATCTDCTNTASWDVKVGSDIVIGFFNGVGNTEKAALDSLERLRAEFGPQYQDIPLEYDWFYNQTACQEGVLGKLPCLDDVAEVFEQRTSELDGLFANRWETFWEILAGRHQHSDSWSGRLIGLLGDGGTTLLQWMDATASAVVNRLATLFFDMLTLYAQTPTYINQVEHLDKLQLYADEGTRFVMVAHSQGNLFVNSAFDGLRVNRPEARAQVVHVAPASPTLRGDYVLADIDLVINALRVSGPLSVPNVNILLPIDRADFSGHGFEPTYLDKTRDAYARTIGMITASLEALVP
jgi:hypothetical protein